MRQNWQYLRFFIRCCVPLQVTRWCQLWAVAAAQVATDHPTNENAWLVSLQTAMKGAPGVFTHIFDAYILVTIKKLAVKCGLGMMDYQEAKKPNPINWIALFDFVRVDVDRIATLFGVKQKALWPPMERSAMKHDFVAQKVSLVEWLYNAPQKVCVHTYP